MRTIKAKDIKSGMTVEWYSYGLTKRAVVKDVNLFPGYENVRVKVDEDYAHLLDYDRDVVVVLEAPKIIQPEEPTSFGACVTVDSRNFIRYTMGYGGPSWSGDDDSVANWAELCNMGQVKIVYKDPFSELDQ